MARFAADDFRGHVLDGATEGKGPLFLEGQEDPFGHPAAPTPTTRPSPLGSSVHGIFQTRILERVARIYVKSTSQDFFLRLRNMLVYTTFYLSVHPLMNIGVVPPFG